MASSAVGVWNAWVGEVIPAELGEEEQAGFVESRVPITALLIDWQNSGSFEGIENLAEYVRTNEGIQVETGKDGARPRNQPMIASADVMLDNVAKRFTPANAGSDLYPFILPDRPIRIGLADATGIAVNLFTGYTDEPIQQPEIEAQRTQIRALGRMTMLKGVQISTPLYSAIRTDTAVGHVLDKVGWPAADRVLSVGDTTMTYWWVDDADAWTALLELLETEGSGASLYEDGDGRIHFENRNYRVTAARCTTSQASFGVGQTMGMRHYQYSSGMREIYNDISMTIKRRAAATSAKVWEYGSTLTLGNSETRTVFAHTTDPLTSVQDVTVTTDYVVDAGSLVSVTTTVLDATTVTIAFVAGAGGATVNGPASATTGPQLRAQAVSVVSEERVTQTASESEFIARTRSLSLNEAGARAEISQPSAEALVDAAAEYYRDPRPTIKIEIVNADAARLAQMQIREISDRITINAGPNEFQGDIWIEQLVYDVTLDGRLVRMGVIGSQALDFTATPGRWDLGAWDLALWGT